MGTVTSLSLARSDPARARHGPRVVQGQGPAHGAGVVAEQGPAHGAGVVAEQGPAYGAGVVGGQGPAHGAGAVLVLLADGHGCSLSWLAGPRAARPGSVLGQRPPGAPG